MATRAIKYIDRDIKWLKSHIESLEGKVGRLEDERERAERRIQRQAAKRIKAKGIKSVKDRIAEAVRLCTEAGVTFRRRRHNSYAGNEPATVITITLESYWRYRGSGENKPKEPSVTLKRSLDVLADYENARCSNKLSYYFNDEEVK